MHLRRLLRAGPALAICLTLAAPALLGQGVMSAPPSAAPKAIPPADSLNALLTLMESGVVSAAEAMPADKYDFGPSTSIGRYTGVRTFSAQVKHLAESNYEFFQGFGAPNPVDAKTIEALKTKDEIVKALKDSYIFAHAISTITPDNAFLAVSGPPPQWKLTPATTAAFAAARSMDHYGQMIEYLRMNGIVPPASRPRSGGSM